MKPTNKNTALTATHEAIRQWRLAHNAAIKSGLELPSTSVIWKMMRGIAIGGGGRAPTVEEDATLVQRVEQIVRQMRAMVEAGGSVDIHRPFVAYHLGLIDGEIVRGMAHKERAKKMGLAPGTYFYRKDRATYFIHERLDNN